MSEDQKPSLVLDIVFDGPPGPHAGRFVEVEDGLGKSINAGHWFERGDGYNILRIPIDGTLATEVVRRQAAQKAELLDEVRQSAAAAEKLEKMASSQMGRLLEEAKVARQAIARLKGELAAAKESIALQQGYLMRCREDDDMRELGPFKPAPVQLNPADAVSRRQPPSPIQPADTYSRSGEKPWHEL